MGYLTANWQGWGHSLGAVKNERLFAVVGGGGEGKEFGGGVRRSLIE